MLIIKVLHSYHSHFGSRDVRQGYEISNFVVKCTLNLASRFEFSVCLCLLILIKVNARVTLSVPSSRKIQFPANPAKPIYLQRSQIKRGVSGGKVGRGGV